MFAKPLFNHRLQPLMQADGVGGGGTSEGGSSEGDGGQSTSDGKENTEKTEDTKEHMIPKSRFDEVNEGYKNMKKELDALKAQQTKAEQARQAKEQEEAEKKGEFENLYNKAKGDLDSFKNDAKSKGERIEALEGVIQGLLDTKLESIDKDYHDLIPEGMTPEQKLAWVSNAEAKGLFGKRSTNEPLGEQTNPSGKQEVDVNSLNPLQLMMSGYSSK